LDGKKSKAHLMVSEHAQHTNNHHLAEVSFFILVRGKKLYQAGLKTTTNLGKIH